MRHQKRGVKLNRTASHRKAMFQNMAASLIRYERIQTTDTKAKALRGFVEPLVTLAKRGDLHARRTVMSRLQDKDGTAKLFDDLAERMRERPGGYTRIVKVGRRDGDNAPISLIEWVDADLEKIMAARGLDEDDVFVDDDEAEDAQEEVGSDDDEPDDDAEE
jgi:large subunit ribosomal protein L17